MPIDPARLARIRSRLLAGLAVAAAAGCGGSSGPERTINEPAEHVNVPPDTTATAAPSGGPEVPEGTHVNTPEDAPHVNTPAPSPKP